MRHGLLVVGFATLLLAACKQDVEDRSSTAMAQDRSDSTGETALDERQTFLKENIEFQLRQQLGDRSVLIGPIEDSDFDGFDQGTFTVGRDVYRFLTTDDDSRIIFLAMDPFTTLSGDEMATILEREAEGSRQQKEEAERDLASAARSVPSRGNPDAAVTVVEFSDFECPYCLRGFNTMEELLEKRGDHVRFVYLHYPLSFHPWAKPSAVASVCAAEQDHDAFWTLHDYYFRNQKAIEPGNVLAKSREALAGTSIDMARWQTCASDSSSSAYKEALAIVDSQAGLGSRLGVTGTPGFFINGTFISGAQPLAAFEAAIDEAMR